MSFINHRGFARRSMSRASTSPLTDEQLRRFVPSAFAEQAHESRSERFAVIPTSRVIDAMRAEGFQPYSAKQSRTRDESRRDFTKHMIRFRHGQQAGGSLKLNETFPEVVLVNANDGTSAYKLMAGMFRLVCLNGMVIREQDHGSVTVKHMGDVRRTVIEGSYEVLDESRRALTAAEAWAGITLNRDAQMALAEGARILRFGDAEGEVKSPITADQLLTPRRHADTSNDLWTVFNRVQENVIKGGLQAWTRDENGRRRRVTTREVQGIDQDVKLNRALWALGARMAELAG